MSLFTLAGRAVQAESESPVNRAQARAMAEAHAMAETEARPEPPPAISIALQRLVDFIPTETITLYWLAVPASKSLSTFLNNGVSPTRATRLDISMFVTMILGLVDPIVMQWGRR
jgi:hypothetical protein